MTNVEIELLSERTIGRNFQIAALGAVFDLLPQPMKDKIIDGVVDGKILLSIDELQKLLNTLSQYLIQVCKYKKIFPELYKAGKGDAKILSSAGIIATQKNLCTALLDSLNNVLKRPEKQVDIPMFLRTYVFAKYRTSLESVEKTTSISLYISVAGAILSLIGKFKVRDTTIELYIIPDGSIYSLLQSPKIYSLIYSSDRYRLDQFIKDIFGKLNNASFEVSTLVAIMAYTWSIAKYVQELPSLDQYYGSFEVFRLVSIKPEYRPQVAWEKPLTISEYLRYLEAKNAIEIPELIRKLASVAPDIVKKEEIYDNVISQCLHEVYGYMESGSLDLLTSCTARIVRILDTLKSKELCRKYVHVCSDLSRLSRLLSNIAS
ncbi:MAG: hypothetical protein ABWW65_04780 [Thermoprotei archaeon]